MKKMIAQIKKILSTPKKIVTLGHINPDGDAAGSILGLSFLWQKMGHECSALLPDALDYTLSWMPGADKILVYKRNPKEVEQLIADAEVVFCMDFNNLQRIGDMKALVQNNVKAKKILIDHHLEPVLDEFDLVISTPNVSSTAELTYNFIRDYGLTSQIDADIATALYVGIITDTGSLCYSVDNTDVYRTVADLVDAGVDTQYVRSRLYNMYPESRLRLTGYALYAKMKVLKNLRSAYMVITQEELCKFHYQKGDSEGLVNYCISMKDIVFGCIIIEHLDRIQLSFRSRGDFDVSRIASEYFEGGGHKNASGGSSYTNLTETAEKLETVLRKYKKELIAVVI